MTNGLDCTGLVVDRDGREIVHGIDLAVPQGSVTALLGANGAGKTTTIEALAGLIPVREGQVRLGGDDVTSYAAVRRARAGLGTVQQGRTVFGQMSTHDNIHIAAADDAAARALESFPELQSMLDRRAGLLSGGEQQMLALARAIAAGPSVLLIDEMSLGLAPVVVDRLLGRIRTLVDEEGLSVLLVEQFALLALGIADHAYVLRRGAITYDGPAGELAASPELLDDAYFGSGRAE